MGIEDIQISEELETNAPSIKYSGNEGPKSPQQMEQMMMAQLEEEYARYVFEMQEQGIEPMSMQQFMEQTMAEGQMSSAQPMAPQGMPPRQMAAFGGIMGMDGRKQYGLGSRLRKLIPNELAKVAETAAPFVAPFNPLAAGLMSGIGGYDRTGNIGSSLKSGLMNYGLGQGARYLGGAGTQKGLNLRIGEGTGPRSFFSSPLGNKSGLGKMFADKFNTAGESMVEGVGEKTLQKTPSSDEFVTRLKSPSAIDEFIKNNQSKELNLLDTAIKSFKDMSPLAQGAIGAGAITALLNMGPDETVSEIMDRGEGLDIKSIRAEVQEAFADSSGDKLSALRVKYPYLGRADTKDFANGGRIGMAEGGIMDLGGMEKDYRAEGGFVPIGKAEKADDVPARLSVNEFVFTADAVRNAGGGDIDKGAEIMENMMKNLEAGGQVSEESQGMQGAQQMFETSERLSEVI